jgi:O-6-methylguanine DNA methyltransferase
MKNIVYQHTPIGLIEITEEEGKLTSLHFVKFQKLAENSSLVLQETKWQLEAYFEGTRKSFNLPLHFNCSPLQEEIYTALLNTPYGTTLSYKALGAMVSDKSISRAVGTAMAKNPFPIIVPCHRVLKNDGTLGKYSAPDGEKSKQWLIDHEKAITLK